MEFKLEGILETLLVGAMVALVLLSLIFFIFGHIWDVPLIRRFFDTLFGELVSEDQHAVHFGEAALGKTRADRPPAASPPPETHERPAEGPPFNFVLILLLALLYGLGVIAEAGSHLLRKADDDEVKRTTFVTVAHGQLKGGTAPAQLARFIADFDACRTFPRQSEKKGEPPTLCGQLDERVVEFFHDAKNAVLQVPEFYEELSALEARINFMRSFSTLTRFLLWELGTVCVLAAISEIMSKKRPGVWKRYTSSVFPKGPWRDAAHDLGQHWVNIAAFHCLILVAACWGLSWVCQKACDYSEEQFSKRIFGYYLALPSERASQHGQEASDTQASDARNSSSSRDVIPKSPYRVFALPKPTGGTDDHHAQRRLGPSAVRILGHSSHVIVASDQGGGEPFWLFTLSEDSTELNHATPIHVGKDGQTLLEQAGAIQSLMAFEVSKKSSGTSSVCNLPTVSDHTNGDSDRDEHKMLEIVAAPTEYPAKTEANLLSFCLDPEEPVINELRPEKIPSPCAVFTKDEGSTHEACTVEGIASRDRASELLFGIQSVDHEPTVAIVRMQRDQKGAWTNPTKIFPFTGNDHCATVHHEAMLGEHVGISDLEIAPSGRLYVTTSLKRDDSRLTGGKAPTPQIRGALWLVELGCETKNPTDPCLCDQEKATLLETFVHKPEGVTYEAGSVLVVFDDEARWKSRQWAPKTFPLDQNESVFTVVPSPEYK